MQSQGFEYFAAGAFVFFLSIGAYTLFVFFLPEWVGLTGNVAKEAEKSHVGGDVEETNFWKNMDAEPVRGSKTLSVLGDGSPKGSFSHNHERSE